MASLTEKFFYDATLVIYEQLLDKSSFGNEVKDFYDEEIFLSVPGMKAPRANFEEASGFGAFLAPGAPFSVEQFNMASDVVCRTGDVIKFVKAGDLDNGNFYEVLSREQRANFFFKSQTVVAKRVEAPNFVKS